MGRTASRQQGVLGQGGSFSHQRPASPVIVYPMRGCNMQPLAANAEALHGRPPIEDACETGEGPFNHNSIGTSPAHPQEGTVRRGGNDRQPDCFV
jgi:hypothetical protein